MKNSVFIKNMVCDRCILVVKQEVLRLHLPVTSVTLGEAEFGRKLTEGERKKIAEALAPLGFELLDDRKSRLIEKIKSMVIQYARGAASERDKNLSDVVSAALLQDYSYLSNLFSATEGITIERYFILQKIERIKELIVYDELSLSEIAAQLNYSSVAYLSNQFKKMTGLTPTAFRKLKEDKRKAIDKV